MGGHSMIRLWIVNNILMNNLKINLTFQVSSIHNKVSINKIQSNMTLNQSMILMITSEL